MLPCHLIEIITPKKSKLNGLWFGPTKPKRVIISIHGLSSSAFSHSRVDKWVGSKTAVITFSNRGHDKVAEIYPAKKGKRGRGGLLAGTAHEIFTDCVDDIQGAINFVRKTKVKDIYLAGHSTGCQKSVYYASKKATDIKGLILLAPVSDYAGALKMESPVHLARATKLARTLVKKGKQHELLPHEIWPDILDAQRFLSLYTPDSKEEIFSYIQPKKNPRTLKAVRLPMLVVLAEKDEHGNLSAKEISVWFQKHTTSKDLQTRIIAGALHSFEGYERNIGKIVANWLRRI